jgi:hypothetical protein
MRCLKYCALAALAMVALAASHSSAQLLTDGSFELPITHDGPPFVGSWEGFSGNFGGGSASSENSTIMPHTGAGHVALNLTSASAFAGVFQDVPGLSAGDTYTFCGWNKYFGDLPVLGTEVRIEWRDDINEISRTPNLVTTLTADYTLFALTATVPAGATIARVVYAIQSFTTSPLGNGTVFIDDFALKVPEPASIALLGLSGMGLAFLRRR